MFIIPFVSRLYLHKTIVWAVPCFSAKIETYRKQMWAKKIVGPTVSREVSVLYCWFPFWDSKFQAGHSGLFAPPVLMVFLSFSHRFQSSKFYWILQWESKPLQWFPQFSQFFVCLCPSISNSCLHPNFNFPPQIMNDTISVCTKLEGNLFIFLVPRYCWSLLWLPWPSELNSSSLQCSTWRPDLSLWVLNLH